MDLPVCWSRIRRQTAGILYRLSLLVRRTAMVVRQGAWAGLASGRHLHRRFGGVLLASAVDQLQQRAVITQRHNSAKLPYGRKYVIKTRVLSHENGSFFQALVSKKFSSAVFCFRDSIGHENQAIACFQPASASRESGL